MLKVKIFLVGIIVLSIVGGILAFKAKRNIVMCTAPRNLSDNLCLPAPRCVGSVVGKFQSGGIPGCITTTNNPADCVGVLLCNLTTSYLQE
jgi:hypothetical protein